MNLKNNKMNQTQTTQTNLTQNNFALKKLQGIKPKGVKVKQDNSKLSRLVSLCDVVNSQFSNLNIAGYLPIFDYVKEKLNNLYEFYKQAMPVKGWQAYSDINLKFKQIFC